MLDIAWPELIVIGAVALVAIGPKDLPKAMYTLGRWAGKARGFARDVHHAIEQVSYEAETAERLKKAQAAKPEPAPTPPPATPDAPHDQP